MSDLLDGTMARMAGHVGPWGDFLDSTLDRVADGAIFGGLALYGAFNDQPWITAAATLCPGHRAGHLLRQGARRGGRGDRQRRHRRARRAADRRRVAALLTGFGVPYVLPAALWLLAPSAWSPSAQRMSTVRTQLTPVAGHAA